MARPSKRRYWLTLKCSRSTMEKAGSHAVRGKPAQSARRDFGRLRPGDGRNPLCWVAWSWILSPPAFRPSAGTPAGTKRNNRKSGMSHFAEHL